MELSILKTCRYTDLFPFLEENKYETISNISQGQPLGPLNSFILARILKYNWGEIIIILLDIGYK